MDLELKTELVRLYGVPFTYALEKTLGFEGGWARHPSDRGGETRYGITQLTLTSFNAFTGLWWTLDGLTRVNASAIYHQMFWKKMGIWRLPSELQGLMFDWSVHAGYFGIRSMQRHLKVKPDGAIGPKTLETLHRMITISGTTVVVRALAIRRMTHLCRLVRRDRKQGDFLVGWWARVNSFLR